MKWTDDLEQKKFIRITVRNYRGQLKWYLQEDFTQDPLVKNKNKVHLCCNACYNHTPIHEAIIPDKEPENIDEYGVRAGLKDSEVYMDLSITIYCSEQCGITGEL